jgi:hypothetical protein
MKAPHSFKISGITYSVTHWHILEDLNPQKHHCGTSSLVFLTLVWRRFTHFLWVLTVTVTLFINLLLFQLLQMLTLTVILLINVLLFQWTFSSQDIQGRFLQLCREAAQQLYYFYSRYTPVICSGIVIYVIINIGALCRCKRYFYFILCHLQKYGSYSCMTEVILNYYCKVYSWWCC